MTDTQPDAFDAAALEAVAADLATIQAHSRHTAAVAELIDGLERAATASARDGHANDAR